MDLKRVIADAVDTAFLAVGNLRQSVTLYRVSDAAPDWSTGTTTVTKTAVTVDAVITEASGDSGDSATSPELSVLIRSTDIGTQPNLYSYLSINGVDHRISNFQQYEGVTILRVKRG